VVVKHYDYARRQVDEGLPDGPFTGVAVFAEGSGYLEGTRTTSGASIYKDNVADHTGTLAQRFLDAGLRSSEKLPVRNSDDATTEVAAVSVRPEIRGISRIRPGGRRRRRRGRCCAHSPVDMRAMARFHSIPASAPACSD